MTNEERVKAHCQELHSRAQSVYDQRFNNVLFDYAAMSRNGTLKRQHLLVNDALAICGSPYHTLSRSRRTADGWVFLAQFIGG